MGKKEPGADWNHLESSKLDKYHESSERKSHHFQDELGVIGLNAI